MNGRKFRKKPIVVEAFQLTPERRVDNSEWPEWLNRAWNMERHEVGSVHPTEGHNLHEVPAHLAVLSITTPEGELTISWGDWIIQGVEGELYPCKPHIFEATYEEVEI